MNLSNNVQISKEEFIKMGHKSEELIRKFYFPRAVLSQELKKGDRILDIGCGYGLFLKVCDKYGLETYGIDVVEEAINEAKKVTKAKLYIHNVDNGLEMFKDEFFDIVTLFDVIEHLQCPYKVLREVYRVLKKNGKIVITTPNLNAILRYLKKDKWHGFRDRTHLYLFVPLSLKFLVERAGFKIVKIETVFRPLPIPNLIKRLLDKTGLGGEIWCIGIKGS